MSAPIRDTAALIKRIEELRDEFVKRFSILVGLARVDSSDRNTSAIVQYQIQTETAALIRAGEDVQMLIRQMQEMWLFGQLNTIGGSTAQQRADDNAKAVANLLKQLTDWQEGRTTNPPDTEPMVTNGI